MHEHAAAVEVQVLWTNVSKIAEHYMLETAASQSYGFLHLLMDRVWPGYC